MISFTHALSFLTLSAGAPASAQYTCTTNYCISSQSVSFQTPPGMAGSTDRDLLPDPLGRPARRDRLEQWHTDHDLHRPGGIRYRVSELRGSKQYSNRPGQVTNWWVYEVKEPKRGFYVFTAAVSFQKGEKGYYAVLNSCKLKPPS